MPYMPKPIDRNQIKMDNLDSMVSWNSMARVIDCFVDHIDMTEMGFTKSEPCFEGRPCYDPQSLLKLFFYGYRNGIRSSRKLAKACENNIEVIWMLGGLTPDFRTIADFRKDNISNLKKVFKEFTRRVTVDMKTGFVSIDGSKFKAANSKDNNFTILKLDDRIKWLDDHTQEYLRLIEQADDEEDSEGTLTKGELEEKLKKAQERLEKYRGYREIMERDNLTQLSLTDAEAMLMKNKNGMDVSFNVQTAVESENHLIMDYGVTNQVTDHGMMAPTTEELKQEMGDKILDAVADKGYDKEEDMVACLEKGVIPHVILSDGKDTYDLEMPFEEADDLHPESTNSNELKKCLHAGIIPEAYKDVLEDIEVVEVRRMIQDENAPKAVSPYGTEAEMQARAAEGYFVRDPERDLVYCPAGNTLRKKCIKPNGATRYANKMACSHCPYRNKCVSDKGITRWKEMDFGKDSLERKAKWWEEDPPKQPVPQENPTEDKADSSAASDMKDDSNTGNLQKPLKPEEVAGPKATSKEKDDSNKKDPPNPTKPKRKFEKVKLVRVKLRPDRKKMDQRKCLSEHPFGTIKRAMGATYFLLKGKLKTTGEFALLSMGYNLARVENMLSFDALMRKVRG